MAKNKLPEQLGRDIDGSKPHPKRVQQMLSSVAKRAESAATALEGYDAWVAATLAKDPAGEVSMEAYATWVGTRDSSSEVAQPGYYGTP